MDLRGVQRSDIDLLDKDRFTEGIPHEWFAWMRANEPVFRHDEPDGPGFWVVASHEDVVACNRDAKTFSSDSDNGGVLDLVERELSQMEQDQGDAKLMLMMDPPDHTRYRKLVNRGFTPRMIGLLEPHVRELTAGIIDDAIGTSRTDGACDFVVDIAAELPLEVIAELIGVPHEDRHKIFEWSNRFIGSDDPEFAVSEAEIQEAQIEMFLYAQQLADARRDDPRDDIITTLLSAEVDGDALSAMDFNLFFLLLAVAGNETTRNAIAAGMNTFLDHPDQWAAFVADPGGMLDTATEEVLRWASPVMYFRRTAMRDTEVGGRAIAAGDKVSLWYTSANRDEAVFDDPYRFDIARSPNPHIAFGGGGPHFCLGAQLARMEIKVLFEELARRAPGIARAGETDRLRSNFIGGIKHLPVTLAPWSGGVRPAGAP